MDSPDMQVKYHKLAAEYSKYRAQNQVLKKAIIDEQSKFSLLNDVVKKRDQAIRKNEQEIESLTFRNQQLARRLSLLQDDLDQVQLKGKRSRSRPDGIVDTTVIDNNVFTEELQAKIQENAMLHAQLADHEHGFRAQISQLEANIEELSHFSKLSEENLEVQKEATKKELNQLVEERVHLEVVAQQRETDLRKTKEELTTLQQLHQQLQHQLQQQQQLQQDHNTIKVDRTTSTNHLTDSATSTPSTTTPTSNHPQNVDILHTVDSRCGIETRRSVKAPSTLNVLRCIDLERPSPRDVLESMNDPIQQFCQGFCDFLQAYQNILNVTKDSASTSTTAASASTTSSSSSSTTSSTTSTSTSAASTSSLTSSSAASFASLLLMVEKNIVFSIQCWRRLGESYREMVEYVIVGDASFNLESLQQLGPVSSASAACSASLRKLLPIITRGCLLALISHNDTCDSWRQCLNQLVASWAAIGPYLSTLANQNVPGKSLPRSAQGRVITLLDRRLNRLYCSLKLVQTTWERNVFNQKSQKSSDGGGGLCNIDDGTRVDAFSLTINKLTEAAHLLSGKFTADVPSCWYRTNNNNNNNNNNNSIDSSSSSPLHVRTATASHVTSPFDEVIQMSDLSGVSPLISGDSGTLSKQLALTTTKLSHLEAEKEHWKLEHQLMQHKHQKDTQRLRDLKEELRRLQNLDAISMSSTGAVSGDDADSARSSINSGDGSDRAMVPSVVGEVDGMCLGGRERENEIRQHMTGRCSQLYLQLTSTTSQTALFQNECECLMRRLVASEEMRVNAEQQVDHQRSSVSQLKETLQITSKNYEEQISTMSVHLADLNEKMVSQTEFIEHLKYEVKNKKSKK